MSCVLFLLMDTNVVYLSRGPSRVSCVMLWRSVLPMLTVGVNPLPCLPRLSAFSCRHHLPRLSRSGEKMKWSEMFFS